MLLRLCKNLKAGGLFLALCAVSQLRSAEPEFEISYFPEVVFKGRALTCIVKTEPARSILVQTNGNEYARIAKSSDPAVEFSFFPETSTHLSFSVPEPASQWSFQIIQPGFKHPLSEKSGFLYHGAYPVILLPEHKMPPPLDRRWQTVDLIRTTLRQSKKPIPTVTSFLSGHGDLEHCIKNVFSDSELQFYTPSADAWFRVHGFLMLEQNVSSSEFVMVETDLYDLERGMPLHIWLMKWQFLLQHLQSTTAYKDGFLVGPVYTDAVQKWQPVLEPELKALAEAHGLRFINQSIPVNVLQDRILYQMQKTYQMP